MKPDAPPSRDLTDSELDTLLRAAEVRPNLPETGPFQAEVWRRIGRARARSFAGWIPAFWKNCVRTLSSPAGAVAMAAAAVLAGLWAGSFPSGSAPAVARAGDGGKSSYVQSVSPFAQGHGKEAR